MKQYDWSRNFAGANNIESGVVCDLPNIIMSTKHHEWTIKRFLEGPVIPQMFWRFLVPLSLCYSASGPKSQNNQLLLCHKHVAEYTCNKTIHLEGPLGCPCCFFKHPCSMLQVSCPSFPSPFLQRQGHLRPCCIFTSDNFY